MARSLLRGKTIKFTSMGDGSYQSAAYDGVGRMNHTYRIERFGNKYKWLLSVDGYDNEFFPTLKAAKERATSIERSEEINER